MRTAPVRTLSEPSPRLPLALTPTPHTEPSGCTNTVWAPRVLTLALAGAGVCAETTWRPFGVDKPTTARNPAMAASSSPAHPLCLNARVSVFMSFLKNGREFQVGLWEPVPRDAGGQSRVEAARLPRRLVAGRASVGQGTAQMDVAKGPARRFRPARATAGDHGVGGRGLGREKRERAAQGGKDGSGSGVFHGMKRRNTAEGAIPRRHTPETWVATPV